MQQLYLIFITFCFSQAMAQSDEANKLLPNKSISVAKINTPVLLDGLLDEPIWQSTVPCTGFSQYFPSDTIAALGETEVHLAHDAEYLYIGIICHTAGNDFEIESLRRDYSFFGFDNISIAFDTYQDKTNALLFGINPAGVRREALISEGGRVGSGFDDSWDNKWDGDAKMHDNKWTAEMKIPFSTLRFKKGATKWGMIIYRFDTQHNEISNWLPISRNRVIMDLSYAGEVVWEDPLKNSKSNISLIPYLANSLTRDYEDVTQENFQNDFRVGGDAKIGLGGAMNLDLTINPDFSQVEVDQQVTNLDRFEISFPERRQFFLENADLFGGFGANRSNPFFSRRIGIALDTTTEINVQNTIYYGARLSGKINNRLRVGLLNMQTAAQPENDLPSFNYTVIAAEQNIFKKSNIAFIGVNKQTFNADNFSGTFFEYNRNIGFEYRLVSDNNNWRGHLTYHIVDSPEEIANKNTHHLQLIYDVRKWRLEWMHNMIGAGYNPEVGFVPRRDILILSPEITHNIYPEKGAISRHSIGGDLTYFYKLGQDDNQYFQDFGLVETNTSLFWDLSFQNTGSVRFGINYDEITLIDDFDPTRIQEDNVFLPAGNTYSFYGFNARYRSDRTQKMTYRFNPFVGTFYNGFRYGMDGSIRYRYQPYGSVSLNFSYNHINLEAPFETANLWLIGPRIDITFTKKVFFTTFVQYNNQSDNLNINARFQWRFKPVSDFFVVYTDNYITDPVSQFDSRNRALVIKFTYWLNL